jgi:hypothetical protein
VDFTDMSRIARSGSLRPGASVVAYPTRNFADDLARSIDRVDSRPWLAIPACRHADGTISSSKTHVNVRRMVSEDSSRVSAIGLSC